MAGNMRSWGPDDAGMSKNRTIPDFVNDKMGAAADDS